MEGVIYIYVVREYKYDNYICLRGLRVAGTEEERGLSFLFFVF